ncbi:MAG: phage holin family protein [Clostridiaceae bacterium]|nr:phage holin family protein [Eubacteriales bacterium]
MKLLMKWLICFAALLVVCYGFPGLADAPGGIPGLAAAAAVLWLLNLLILPMLQLLAIPFSLITFGIASLFVSAAMVALTDAILPSLDLNSFWLCLLASIIVSVGNMVLLRAKRRQ